jgi:hypothetical protein
VAVDVAAAETEATVTIEAAGTDESRRHDDLHSIHEKNFEKAVLETTYEEKP